MKFEYTIKNKIWLWNGESAWHFITIHKKVSEQIKRVVAGPRRGFGAVKVRARIGKTEWITSIFPTKEGEYLLPVKASVRKAERVNAGNTVSVTFYLVGY